MTYHCGACPSKLVRQEYIRRRSQFLENYCTNLCVTVSRNEHRQKILENLSHKRAWCYLCKFFDDATIETRTPFGCFQCQTPFHVNCFTAYHMGVAIVTLNPDLHAHEIASRITGGQHTYRKRGMEMEYCFESFHPPNEVTQVATDLKLDA